jgi:hypothetical protein
VGAGDFFLSETFIPALGPTQPRIQWVLGFFPGGKVAGDEVDHSPPSSVKVKNEWHFMSALPTSLRGQGQLYLFLPLPLPL